LKEFDSAISIYRRVIELRPGAAEPLYNLGVALFRKKEYDEAEKYFRETLEAGDYPNALLYLGAIYQLREDFDTALKFYRRRLHKREGDDDYYAKQAIRGIRNILTKHFPEEKAAAEIERVLQGLNVKQDNDK